MEERREARGGQVAWGPTWKSQLAYTPFILPGSVVAWSATSRMSSVSWISSTAPEEKKSR